MVVHTGRAVFHAVGGRQQVSGADVILAHRLLKNSVPSHEYLLMSGPAYRDLGAGMELAFSEGSESYDEFGTVTTYVHLMAETTERMRDSLYAMEPAALASRARGYARISLLPHFSAVIDQLRHPSVDVGLPKRVAFALGVTIASPGCSRCCCSRHRGSCCRSAQRGLALRRIRPPDDLLRADPSVAPGFFLQLRVLRFGR